MYVGPWQEYRLAKFRSETLDALEDVAAQFPELQDILRRRAERQAAQARQQQQQQQQQLGGGAGRSSRAVPSYASSTGILSSAVAADLRAPRTAPAGSPSTLRASAERTFFAAPAAKVPRDVSRLSSLRSGAAAPQSEAASPAEARRQRRRVAAGAAVMGGDLVGGGRVGGSRHAAAHHLPPPADVARRRRRSGGRPRQGGGGGGAGGVSGVSALGLPQSRREIALAELPPPELHPRVERRLAEVERMKALYLGGGGGDSTATSADDLCPPQHEHEQDAAHEPPGSSSSQQVEIEVRRSPSPLHHHTFTNVHNAMTTTTTTSPPHSHTPRGRRRRDAEVLAVNSTSPVRRWGESAGSMGESRTSLETPFGSATSTLRHRGFVLPGSRQNTRQESRQAAPSRSPRGSRVSSPALARDRPGSGALQGSMDEADIDSLLDWTAALDLGDFDAALADL